MNHTFRVRLLLGDKLLIAVTLLVVLLVVGILYTLNNTFESAANDAMANELTQNLSVLNRFMKEQTTSLSAKTVSNSEDPRLKAILDNPNPDVTNISDLCHTMNETAQEPMFLVTDKTGIVVFDSLHIPEVDLARWEGREPDPQKMGSVNQVFAAGWPNVRQALQGMVSAGGFIYPFPIQDKTGEEVKKAFQIVTVPIRIKERILGTITMGFPLDDGLSNQLKEITHSETAVYIGHKIFSSSWNENQKPLLEKGFSNVEDSPEKATKSEGASQPFSVTLGNDHYLSFLLPFTDTQNQLMGDYIIFRPLDENSKLQDSLQQSVVLIGIFGAVFAFIIRIFIVRRITEPLNRILRGVHEVGIGNLDTEVIVKTKDELEVLATAFNAMIQGLKEKERVTQILGKYITPEVAKKVLALKDGENQKGERRDCVVMFTDIRGFTVMSENALPEKIVASLNEYFTLMVDVIIKYEGTLDKFIGDAIMAVWGSPIQFEDKELRAVKAALEMQKALDRLNKSRIEKKTTPLTMGVGINSGVVISGNLGSEKRTDYTVIGEEVNLSFRICSKAAPGQILISESTYRRLKGLVNVRALEPIALKGFSETFKVYEVLGLIEG